LGPRQAALLACIMAAQTRQQGLDVTTRRTLWFGWLLALLAMAGFSALGTWQLGRMQLKQAMLDDAAAVLEQRAAAPWAQALKQEDGYDWVRGSGVFADAPALLLDNQMRNGRAGVRAYRVFLPDAETPGDILPPVLVDLGWLALPDRRILPQIPRPDGPQWVEGLLTPPPSSGLAMAPATQEAGDTLLTVSLHAPDLAHSLQHPRLSVRVLRLDPALPLGYPRDLDILPNTLLPARHLGYAVQWYALALAVLVTALILTFRKRRPR